MVVFLLVPFEITKTLNKRQTLMGTFGHEKCVDLSGCQLKATSELTHHFGVL